MAKKRRMRKQGLLRSKKKAETTTETPAPAPVKAAPKKVAPVKKVISMPKKTVSPTTEPSGN